MLFLGMETSSHTEYSVVTGYFLQDDPATNPDGFDLVWARQTTVDFC
jgi:hypothetical protein